MILPIPKDIPPDYKKYQVLRDKINEIIDVINNRELFPNELIVNKKDIEEYFRNNS